MAVAPSTRTTRSRDWFHTVTAIFFTILAAIAVSEIRIRTSARGFQKAFDTALATGTCEGRQIRGTYTGIEAIDSVLRLLVTAFLPGAAGFEKGSQVLQAYFLFEFYPVIAIWCIEAGRKGNSWSLISFPAFYGIFYQTVGGAIIIPIFYLAYMWTSGRKDYFSSESRKVSPAYAKALIPALIQGYLIPTIMVYLPYEDLTTTEFWVAFWQPVPAYVSILAIVFTQVFSGTRSSDVRFLNITYVTCFVFTALFHLATMFYCLTSSDPALSLSSVFDLRIVASGSPLTVGIKYIFQLDYWVIAIASVAWAYLAIYELRQVGKTQLGMVQALLLLTVGSFALGPGAALAATWYWREQLLAKNKAA